VPHPLELSYNWRTPVGVATTGAVVCIGLVSSSHVTGWLPVAIILAGLWLIFMVVVWLRTRAYMLLDGPILRVRRYHGFHDLDGRTVARVQEYLTPSGPSYKVYLQQEMSPGQQRYFVPAALLRKGHSTLFDWVLTWSPHAQLDKRSLRTVDQLRTRGLIDL
jgi:hypothetical protein